MTDLDRHGRLLRQTFEPQRGAHLVAALVAASVLTLALPAAARETPHAGKATTHGARGAEATGAKARSKGGDRAGAQGRLAGKASGGKVSPKETRAAARAQAGLQARDRKGGGLLPEVRASASRTPSLRKPAPAPIQQASNAEARLIGVYEMFGRGQSRAALVKARELVRDHPNFQLAQLVYGDLLAAQVSPANAISDTAAIARMRGNPAMDELHAESARRLQALRERPPPGTVPSQFLTLSTRSHYAIAVDASRSRLYLLENTDKGLKLAADYYVSVGKSGTGKSTEGDARTPLGVYYITSSLDPKTLKDFYGAGALPLNYPNPYDVRRGKTGGGIWLHGTPPQQFARAPLASDGCVVVANPDLQQLLRKVQIGATPVVTARSLQWISPVQAEKEAQTFSSAMDAWKEARASGNETQLQKFYLPDFQRNSNKKTTEGIAAVHDEVSYAQGKRVQIKDLSYLHWRDGDDTMVATFGEVIEGERSGRTRRQYWLRQGGEWKLFHEEILG